MENSTPLFSPFVITACQNSKILRPPKNTPIRALFPVRPGAVRPLSNGAPNANLPNRGEPLSSDWSLLNTHVRVSVLWLNTLHLDRSLHLIPPVCSFRYRVSFDIVKTTDSSLN